ncbi:MAG: alpha/beta hydrolase, partial [Novosphingobium sp.]|nr:alpha/beta hydrolase [Novosphingobium sp.]
PLFRAILASNGSQDEVPLSEARAASHKAMEQFVTGFYAPRDPLPSEADHSVPVAGGSIAVRVYCPEPAGPALPCHLYFHGGGFWLGTLDHFDALCRAVAVDAHCVVMSVDYRLAPEHKFPTAAQDSYAALQWACDNADTLGIDPTRISVGGVSAGGNLATVTALMARDRCGPGLVLQVLEVPVTDLSRQDPLHIADEGIELPSGKDVYCRHYLSDPAEALDPLASPLLAQDLSGLPPALVMCAEYDPLAAEGKAYADRLKQAGVPVEHICWPGQFHGAQPMAKLIPQEAAAYHNRIVGALRQAFRKDRG